MNPIDIVLLLAIVILVWRGIRLFNSTGEAREEMRVASAEPKRYISPFGASMPSYPPLSPLVAGERMKWDAVRNCWSTRTGINTELQGLPRRAPKNCENCGAPVTAPVCDHCGTHH